MTQDLFHEPPQTYRRRRQPEPKGRTWLPLVISLAMLGIVVAAGFVFLAPLKDKIGFGQAEDFSGPPGPAATVKIEKGESGGQIATALKDAGVVASREAFIKASASDPDSAKIQPGTYEIPTNISASQAIEELLDPARRASIKFQAREGLRSQEIYELLAQALNVSVSEVEKAAAGDIGLPKSAKGSTEGYLFPATYSFAPDITPGEALSQMVERTTKALTSLNVPAGKERDIIIKASIIQDEARNEEDMKKVSSVIDNRLAIDMRLQMDSTVNYVVKDRKLSTKGEWRQIKDKHNTYVYPGLPIGPINSPGEMAINAAMNPAKTDYLFFVTVDPESGETLFAKTKSEHDRNVEIWRNN